MIKSVLTSRLAARHPDHSHGDADHVIATILDSIAKALSRGQRVELRGFGTFSARQREAHIGRNPKNGEAVAVAQKRVPYFRCSHSLRKRINEAAAGLKNGNESIAQRSDVHLQANAQTD